MDKYLSYIGKILDDRYKILDVIGRGGTAIVMKAKDLIMDRLVAIKILNEDEDHNGEALQRFVNEAQAMAKLSHRNITAIYDVAIYDDLKYIVMEFLDGITLKTYIERKGALNYKETSFYVLQILRALEYAHSRGIVHHDIKPQNVVLLRNGTAKLTDFGIARVPGSELTINFNERVGTPNYISPEQLKGEKTDQCSDIYSLGIVMYEMMTGVLPFVGETADIIANKQINEISVKPSTIKQDISKGADCIIMKALEKNPRVRFGSAHAMRKAIEYLLKFPGTVFATTGDDMADPTERALVDFNSVDVDDEITPDVFLDDKALKRKRREERQKHRLETKKIKKRNSFMSARSNSMFPIIAGVVISFLIVFSIVGVIVMKDLFQRYISNDSKDRYDGIEFDMPGLIGENWNDIKDQLLEGNHPQAKGIKITVEKVEFKSNDSDYGVVYFQEPREGARVKLRNGSEYYVINKLYVSIGKQKAIMPDVVNLSAANAKALISSEKGLAGSKVIVKEDSSLLASVPNQVVRTVPAAGSLVDINSEITIYISPNPKSVISMPNLYGMTESEAASVLSLYGLTYIVEKVESDLPEGFIIGQSVNYGDAIERGKSVTLQMTTFVPSVDVIDYVGLNIEDIRPIFEEVGITVAVVYEDWDILDEGTIIAQSVLSGTTLKKGESIIFTVSRHSSMDTTTETEPGITVPDDTTTTAAYYE